MMTNIAKIELRFDTVYAPLSLLKCIANLYSPNQNFPKYVYVLQLAMEGAMLTHFSTHCPIFSSRKHTPLMAISPARPSARGQ